MKVNDAISGAIFIALAGGVFVATQGFEPMPGQSFGAGFFPRVIASCMALCGGWLVVSGVAARGAAPNDAPWARTLEWMGSPSHVANFLLVLAALVFYILASDWLGFLPTAFIALFVLLLKLRGASFAGSSAAIALVAVLGMQQFFGEFLRVPLPWGLLQPYAW